MDKMKAELEFEIDFIEHKLGLPRQMRFGAYSLYGVAPEGEDEVKVARAD